jgi:hypothetical protein
MSPNPPDARAQGATASARASQLPAAVTVPCTFCGDPVDPNLAATWRRVKGWAKLVSLRSSGNRRTGISDIALRTLDGEDVACDQCIRRLKRGVAPRQMDFGS